MPFQNHSLSISASIGVSVFPADARNTEDLFRLADSALYKVKGEGKSGWLFADGESCKTGNFSDINL